MKKYSTLTKQKVQQCMFIIAMRTLFSFILREMLRLLQKPVMIHLAGLWLATDGRATVDSCLHQLHQKQHVKQLCAQLLQVKIFDLG